MLKFRILHGSQEIELCEKFEDVRTFNLPQAKHRFSIVISRRTTFLSSSSKKRPLTPIVANHPDFVPVPLVRCTFRFRLPRGFLSNDYNLHFFKARGNRYLPHKTPSTLPLTLYCTTWRGSWIFRYAEYRPIGIYFNIE